MPEQLVSHQKAQILLEAQRLSGFERVILKRFHPRGVFLETVGIMWLVYFLWEHNWILGVSMYLIFRVIGYASVKDASPEMMADTVWGRIGLLHLHPVNMFLQLLSLIPIFYGVWQHSTELILLGLSIMFMGHSYGWSKVDHHFSQERRVAHGIT